MAIELPRRALLGGVLTVFASGCPNEASSPARSTPPPNGPSAIAELEGSLGGRIGVFALDTGSGEVLAHRADERFAMCSTFKWALAAAVLGAVDRGDLGLEDAVAYAEKDLLEHAPTTRANVASGSMTIGALAEAAVVVSDNTAANLLLSRIAGPPGLTAFLRKLGDEVTRLDRDEPMLNTNLPGDPRDTTSPRSMVGTMKAILVGEVLAKGSRDRLLGWMRACKTGAERLRAGLPADWVVGDKTGTGNNGASNDVAIAESPGKSPILIASYLTDSTAQPAELNAAHAKIAGVVARAFHG